MGCIVVSVCIVVILWDLQGLCDLAQPRCYFAVFVTSSHRPSFWASLSYGCTVCSVMVGQAVRLHAFSGGVTELMKLALAAAAWDDQEFA